MSSTSSSDSDGGSQVSAARERKSVDDSQHVKEGDQMLLHRPEESDGDEDIVVDVDDSFPTSKSAPSPKPTEEKKKIDQITPTTAVRKPDFAPKKDMIVEGKQKEKEESTELKSSSSEWNLTCDEKAESDEFASIGDKIIEKVS